METARKGFLKLIGAIYRFTVNDFCTWRWTGLMGSNFATLAADSFEDWFYFRVARANVAIPNSGGVYVVRWPPFSYPTSCSHQRGQGSMPKAAWRPPAGADVYSSDRERLSLGR